MTLLYGIGFLVGASPAIYVLILTLIINGKKGKD